MMDPGMQLLNSVSEGEESMISFPALSFCTQDFDERLQLTWEVISASHFSNPPMIIFMKGNLNEEEKD